MSKHAAEFVALVTDGQSIDGYGARCDKCGQPTEASNGRKERFLKLGRAVMKDLAKLLAVDPKEVTVNPAGPAISGDVSFTTPELYVIFTHHQPRNSYGDFLARPAGSGAHIWLHWEELLDIPAVVKKIAALKPTEEAVDPLT